MKKNDYDVVIVGGGTAGCSCAWSASKLGLKTLLIEKNSYLGGAITSQLVIPAMKTDNKGLNTEFYDTLCKIANSQNAQITYADENQGWLNPIILPNIISSMLQDVGVNILYSSKVTNAENKTYESEYINNEKVLSINIETNYSDNKNINIYTEQKYNDNAINRNNIKINAKYFIDATGDANFSKLLGAKMLPFEKSQALSLRFIMSNIDKKSFAQWLLQVDSNRNVTTAAKIEGDIHLSTACTWDTGSKWALKPLFDQAVSSGELKDTDRAYFQIFSIAGEYDKIAFNCPRIITDKDLDPLNKQDMELAKGIGIESIERIVKFCRKYFVGFENAELYKIADSVGVRESRRVKGKYILTKEDIYEAKEFQNPVAYSNYPIDIHSVKKDEYVLDYVQKTYAVPLESLIVDGFNNLYVIGRCLSADFYAQAAVRIQPTCFSMGEGLAKYLSLL